MAGNSIGGKKTAEKIRANHGKDFYARIAREGQKVWDANGRKPRGFAYHAIHNPEKVRAAGIKGGQKSRRKPKEKP